MTSQEANLLFESIDMTLPTSPEVIHRPLIIADVKPGFFEFWIGAIVCFIIGTIISIILILTVLDFGLPRGWFDRWLNIDTPKTASYTPDIRS